MNTNERTASALQPIGELASMGGVRDGSPAAPRATELHAALDVYRRELMRWIDDSASSDSTLLLASQLLCDMSRERGMLPEQVLIAVHPDGTAPPWGSHGSAHQVRQESRYRWAIRLLLRTYFGLEGRKDSSSRFAR